MWPLIATVQSSPGLAMEVFSTVLPLILKSIRWIARVLSAIVISGSLIFFLGDVLSPPSLATVLLSTADVVQLLLAAIQLIGLGLAWKRELLGGSTALVAFIVNGIINPRTVFFPLLMIPITTLLFLFCRGLARSPLKANGKDASPTKY